MHLQLPGSIPGSDEAVPLDKALKNYKLLADPSRHKVYPSSVSETYSHFQQALHSAFDLTRTGRLVEASRQLTEISAWLVTHARDLGKYRLSSPHERGMSSPA
jgi:hypothetical protein